MQLFPVPPLVVLTSALSRSFCVKRQDKVLEVVVQSARSGGTGASCVRPYSLFYILYPISYLLSFIFCLLSSIFYLLYSLTCCLWYDFIFYTLYSIYSILYVIDQKNERFAENSSGEYLVFLA